MASRKEARFRLSSLQLKKPGLLELLFRRSLIVGQSDFLFHFGVWGSVITGLIMEISYLVDGVARFFAGWGWLVSWSHGITGLLIIVGGIGFLARYSRNPFFRLAYGRVFFLDLAFLAALATVGIIQALQVYGFLAVLSFTTFSIKWFGTLHLVMLYSWLVASLLAGGAVRHAIGTIAWRLTDSESRPMGAMIFGDACGKCGRCVEVCPTFEAFNGNHMEAPVIKLRKYYQIHKTRKLTPSQIRYVSEQMAVCAQCNLCAGVCPYSFNFVAMYQDMLADAQELAGLESAEVILPHA